METRRKESKRILSFVPRFSGITQERRSFIERGIFRHQNRRIVPREIRESRGKGKREEVAGDSFVDRLESDADIDLFYREDVNQRESRASIRTVKLLRIQCGRFQRTAGVLVLGSRDEIMTIKSVLKPREGTLFRTS
jgi:hypothetical protein